MLFNTFIITKLYCALVFNLVIDFHCITLFLFIKLRLLCDLLVRVEHSVSMSTTRIFFMYFPNDLVEVLSVAFLTAVSFSLMSLLLTKQATNHCDAEQRQHPLSGRQLAADLNYRDVKSCGCSVSQPYIQK